MAYASTNDESALEVPKMVRELVLRAQLVVSDDELLAGDVAGLADAAGTVGDADARRLLALDLGWVLASREHDVAAAGRIRARLLAAADDPEGAGEAWLEAAQLALVQGDRAGAAGDLDEAAACLPDDAAITTLRSAAELAAAIAHPSAAADWHRVAAALERTGDINAAAHALHEAWWAGGDDGLASLERAAAFGDASGWAARAASILAFLDDRFEDSEQLAQQALQHARRSRDRALEAVSLHGVACARSVVGDVGSAITVQRQALAIARAIDDRRTLDSGGVNLVAMLVDDLRGDEALSEVERLHANRGADADEPGAIAEAAGLRAWIVHARGDVPAAMGLLDELSASDELSSCEPIARAHVAYFVASACVDAGERDVSIDEALVHMREAAVATGMGALATRASMLDATRSFDHGDVAAACTLLASVEVAEHDLMAAELASVLVRAALAARDEAAVDRAKQLLDGCRCTARIVRVARREADAARDLLTRGDSGALVNVADEWVRRERPIDAGRALIAGAIAAPHPRTTAELAARACQVLASTGALGPLAQARRLASTGDDEDLAAASDSPLFEGVDARVRDELLAHAVDVRRPQGSVLHEADDAVESLWLLRAGRVRLCCVTDDDRRLTIELLDPGAAIGDHALLGLPTAGARAECEEDVVLAALPIERVRAASAKCPRLAANLLGIAGARVDLGRRLAERVAFWTVDRRLARCILDLDAQYGHPTLDGGRIINRTFTHFQLAELVNARRETVGDFLKRQRAAGTIELRGRRIVVRDADALERLVRLG